MFDKHDIVVKIANDFKQPKVRISIWAVNGSQNEVHVNHVISVMIYTEIYVTVFFIDNYSRPCFTTKTTPPLAPVERSSFLIWIFEIYFFSKERFIS